MPRRSRPVRAAAIVEAIKASGLSIYDSLEDLPELYLDTEALESILNQRLAGLNLDFPLRTRSKVAKAKVCEVLGYPVPRSFQRTKPRFPGQNFDTYVQKSNNVQIWNQEVAPSRRYVLIRVDAENVVSVIRVVTGNLLAELDRTGTLTHKYQAKSRAPVSGSVLVSVSDTANVTRHLFGPEAGAFLAAHELPKGLRPDPRTFLPISALFRLLSSLVGTVIRNPGIDQERTRAAVLHKLVCRKIGGAEFADTGQFPDVVDQLLELKLQTASTIDLGLISPDDAEPLANFPELYHCDVRYAVFYATLLKSGVRLDAVVLTTGADFFSFFQRFEGKVRNAKLQIPLPRGFFGQVE